MAFTENEENLINLILQISEVKNQEVGNTYFVIILTKYIKFNIYIFRTTIFHINLLKL